MNNEFNLVVALRTLLKWRKPILGLTAAAAVIAVLVSLFVLKEYFLSYSTFYPINQYLNDRAMIFNTESGSGQTNYYGEETDVSRCITVANSTPVIDYVIHKYNLAAHYDIDTNAKYWRTKVRKEFDGNYKAIKTDNDAIEITLYDTDPQLAADMVNDLVTKVDELNKKTINDNKQKLYAVLVQQLEEQQQKVAVQADSLAALTSRYAIKVSSSGESGMVVNGNNAQAVEVYRALSEKQTSAIKEMNNRINIKEQMEVSIRNDNSSLSITERAFASDKKEKPVRWLVVIVTVLLTLFVSLMGVLLIERFNEIKQQL